ncbi:THUMP domain-containing protein 1-like [Oscarella lobularis]|uniref:THUMP domain-containing protein 1-like n=1 Tax=Oscarella lobularis TaxID=121494 RepID=UPI00331406E3
MSMESGRKRKKGYRGNDKKKSRPRQELTVGARGFLVTTNDHQKEAIGEIYDLLNEYVDVLHETEDASSDETLEKEIESLKNKGKRRFRAVFSGARNVTFFYCNDDVDPTEIAHRILTDAKTTGQSKSRYCLRLLPVQLVCHPELDDLKRKVPNLLEPQFHAADQSASRKFAVVYKARNNDEVKRDDIIKTVAHLVTQPTSESTTYQHVVDLKNPDLVIVVEIVKNLCLMSVVKDYYTLKKYNLHEAAAAGREESKASKVD